MDQCIVGRGIGSPSDELTYPSVFPDPQLDPRADRIAIASCSDEPQPQRVTPKRCIDHNGSLGMHSTDNKIKFPVAIQVGHGQTPRGLRCLEVSVLSGNELKGFSR